MGITLRPLVLASVLAIAGCAGGVTVTSTHQSGSMTGHLIGGLSPDGGDVARMLIRYRPGTALRLIGAFDEGEGS